MREEETRVVEQEEGRHGPHREQYAYGSILCQAGRSKARPRGERVLRTADTEIRCTTVEAEKLRAAAGEGVGCGGMGGGEPEGYPEGRREAASGCGDERWWKGRRRERSAPGIGESTNKRYEAYGVCVYC
jgi:hypothetical protein